jgi:tetratricopeptide (TPR) repeat protein
MNQIGEAFKLYNKFQNAEIYFKQSLTLFQELNISGYMLATAVKGVAESLVSQEKYHEAFELYQQALTKFELIDDKKSVAKTNILIGELYAKKGLNHKAVEYFQQGLHVAQIVFSINEIIRSHWGMS